MGKDINIRFLNDCLIIYNKILVIGDLHIGYEGFYNGEVLFPRVHLGEIIDKLNEIFLELSKSCEKIEEIVLLGDVKHDFGSVTRSEWIDSFDFFNYLKDNISKDGKIIVVRGNHDNILEPVARKNKFELIDCYSKKINGKKFSFLHGHKLFEQCFKQTNRQTDSKFILDKNKNEGVLVFGHLHPAITLYDKYKSEKFKCFLRGKWKGKLVYILPSFGLVRMGFDLREINEKNYKKNPFIIPFKDLREFEVIIYNNKNKKEYDFGKLKNLINKD